MVHFTLGGSLLGGGGLLPKSYRVCPLSPSRSPPGGRGARVYFGGLGVWLKGGRSAESIDEFRYGERFVVLVVVTGR